MSKEIINTLSKELDKADTIGKSHTVAIKALRLLDQVPTSVCVLSTAGRDSKVLGVFVSVEAADKFAKHFKYDDYVIEPFTIETLKGWK